MVKCSLRPSLLLLIMLLGSRNRKMRKVDMNDFEDKLESLITKVGEKVRKIRCCCFLAV